MQLQINDRFDRMTFPRVHRTVSIEFDYLEIATDSQFMGYAAADILFYYVLEVSSFVIGHVIL